MSKLTLQQVAEIRREWNTKPRPSLDRLGSKYGVSVSTIVNIVNGKTWKTAMSLPKLQRDEPASPS
jgi:hypothetical protein